MFNSERIDLDLYILTVSGIDLDFYICNSEQDIS